MKVNSVQLDHCLERKNVGGVEMQFILFREKNVFVKKNQLDNC